MATQIVPKKSVIPGAVPTSDQLALGGISINHTDRRIFARNPSTGEVYKLAGAKDAPDRVWIFDADGDTTYLGYFLYSDVPSTGSIYDAESWEISRTIFAADGNSSSEASATGAWSNKSELSYS